MPERHGTASKESSEENEWQLNSTELALESESNFEDAQDEEFYEEEDVPTPLNFDHHSDGTSLRGLHEEGGAGYGFDSDVDRLRGLRGEDVPGYGFGYAPGDWD